MLARLTALLILGFLAFGALAQDRDARLINISKRLEAANALYLRGNGLTLNELSKLATELEDILGEMRQVNRDFGTEREKIEEQFFEESKELTTILGFITTLENAPAPGYLLHPQGALGSVRANQLMEVVLPPLETRLKDIGLRLADWRYLKGKEVQLQASAEDALDEINNLRREIIEYDRSGEPKRQVEQPMVLDALFAVSDNLNDFVTGMRKLPVKGDIPASFDFKNQAGEINLPADGPVYPYREGLQIATRNIHVRAPFPATIRFAAEFLDYGNLVILEPEKDILIVFAGMDEISVTEGDIIAAGDIVGFFATLREENGENQQSPLAMSENKLYVETRIKGVPVNSLDYFKAPG